ncbi:MAG: DUF4337 domain-containing protein [Candidatus Caenarcaniphilales bacterium]|nr:DUF4337 domain-containing protein [Candidatus Caenarcaniphilales bacterium]
MGFRRSWTGKLHKIWRRFRVLLHPKTKKLESTVALTASLMAALLAINGLISHDTDKNMLLYRSLANNHWALYQAKRIKRHTDEISRVFYEIKSRESPKDCFLKEGLERFTQSIHKYDIQSKLIEREAYHFELMSKIYDQAGNFFDLAEAFFQIALVISALTIIMHSYNLWRLCVLFGTIATLVSIFGVFQVYFSKPIV